MVRAISSSTTATTCQAMMARTTPAPTALTARIASARRKAVARKSLARAVTNHVSGSAHGAEQRRVEVPVDLGPEPRHVDVDDVGLRIEMVVPDMFEQHGPGDDLAGVLHQVFQQAELARLQHDLLAAAGHLVGEAVEREVADPVHCLFGRPGGAAARQGLDPGEQFGECVRLGEIVVAAGPEALDPVVDLPE